MKIYIPPINWQKVSKKEINPIIRPFINDRYEITYDLKLFKDWGIYNEVIELVDSPNNADFVLFPYPLKSEYSYIPEKASFEYLLKNLPNHGKIVVYISGDFGAKYQENEKVIYLRMGGFNSRENQNTWTFPFLLSDRFEKHQAHFDIPQKPILGFCGNANLKFKELLSGIKSYGFVNLRRLYQGSFDLEPFFISAFKRYMVLKKLESSSIKTNFIYRGGYRANARTGEQRNATTQEYYRNIKESTHILCMRGTGNFSVRYWETLMMGRIPVVIDTDCLDGHLGLYNDGNQFNVKLSEIDKIEELLLKETKKSMLSKMKANREAYLNGNLNWIFERLKNDTLL